MKFIRSGRKHYLEFLRNLTPQVLLLSFALTVGSRLNFGVFDLSNWLPTAIFFVLLIAFLSAFYANCCQFVAGVYGDFGRWSDKIGRAAASNGRAGRRRIMFIICALWRYKKIVFLEVIFIVFFIQIAFSIVTVSAILAATRQLQLS
ncbi:hypothetical protein ACJO2A_23445 [Vibrio parahaemolyticus]|uniref:hypothetical protein n=1 Tax=Vibrio TaxID=662 RepID=UPI000813BA8E|nr:MULTISPECIES: hypothetical protein [Vibrio harveyi group]EJE8549575.1 hypothetical protein [Vibrio vulnificus]OOI00034.1 hypothetical protein BIW15_22300 [Vibrio sp. SALL6]AYF20052.1 hypothetical protein FORC71_1680 [Vibrio parahaemolyticus]EGQ9460251.1 hypothetical protein [Vibrio parahaemolyticus]EGR0804761.1 hypothetical protein [Vibrio alginolyticus]